MKTKRQEELVNTFLSELDNGTAEIYRDIIAYLSELGYKPSKDRSNIVFKHDLHNKQLAKMGTRNSKNISPFFALRFSACREYSQRFTDIIGAAIIKSPAREARCIYNGCSYCKGEPITHVYTHTFPDGVSKAHCGAYVLEIPDITEDDVGEIYKLIKEEHEYLLKVEAGITVTP